VVLGYHMQSQIAMVRCGVSRCSLGSFGAFFKGGFFHLKWINDIEQFIYLNFSGSPDDLKRSTGSLTLKFFNGQNRLKVNQ
jgi:hypothetical protein